MSFLSDYLKVAEGNESPVAYHQWCALSALSTAAGRRFKFNLGHITYHPNLYVLLVGNAGVKKTSALSIAKQMVELAQICPMAASATTPQAIAKLMGNEKFKGKRTFTNDSGIVEEYTQYAIYASEFITFIGDINPLAMMAFLTDVWDQKIYHNEYKGSGTDFIIGPYITLLGALVPETMKGLLKQNLVTSGAARRIIFVYGFIGNPVPFPSFSEEQKLATRRCVDYLTALQARSGVFKMDSSGEAWWEAWYVNNHKTLKDKRSYAQSYYNTKGDLLLKVAMLLALSDEGPLTITASAFQLAEESFFCYVDQHLDRVFEGTGQNPASTAASQICRMLETPGAPPMNKKVLLMQFFDQAPSIRELEDTVKFYVTNGRLAEREVVGTGSDGVQRLLGVVIGTPSSLAAKSPTELHAIVSVRAELASGTGTGSSPAANPTPSPQQPLAATPSVRRPSPSPD